MYRPSDMSWEGGLLAVGDTLDLLGFVSDKVINLLGFVSRAAITVLINSADTTFSVCISPNGNGMSAYAKSGVFTGMSFPSALALPASALTQSDLTLLGLQIVMTALAAASCFMISSR